MFSHDQIQFGSIQRALKTDSPEHQAAWSSGLTQEENARSQLMTISVYMDSHCTIKLKLLGQSSEEVIRNLLETLFHPETVNIYNLKPSPLGFKGSELNQEIVQSKKETRLGDPDPPVVTNVLVGSSGGSVVKNPPANASDSGLIPGSGRSPGEGNGNPLQYSCLENPMDRGAWRATVHCIAKSQTRLSD